MYEYKCLKKYHNEMGAELTALSKKGWGLVGQPIPSDHYMYATVRRLIVD